MNEWKAEQVEDDWYVLEYDQEGRARAVLNCGPDAPIAGAKALAHRFARLPALEASLDETLAAAVRLYEALDAIENDEGHIPAAVWEQRNEAMRRAIRKDGKPPATVTPQRIKDILHKRKQAKGKEPTP